MLQSRSATSRPDTQDEIAAMVGSVREVVQRALKALEHAGLVESERGRIHVIDVEALSTWTEQTKLTSNDGATYDSFGWVLRLSEDEQTLLATAVGAVDAQSVQRGAQARARCFFVAVPP